jgi:nucleotide-binding universal stress UspA family protein
MPTFATLPAFRLAPDAGRPPFPRILCGLNGSRASEEAAQYALALAAGGATLHFMAIADEVGTGPTRSATLSSHRADVALAEAHDLARLAGVTASCARIDDPEPVARLLDEARDHDVLVVGAPIRSRTQGMLTGETAGVVLHRSPVPVLLARRSGREAACPAGVLVATDARPACREAVIAGARIAQRHGVPIMLLHVAETPSQAEHHELALQATAIKDTTGADPIVLSERGRRVARILEIADAHDDTLIVMGASGRRGLDALASVSERVGARARGPVLVLRH